jgi:D-sedoheptulose 7-phosphate isomerase
MQMLPLALLAGGLATRLKAIAEGKPKSLVPVKGEPFIAHQLRLLRREGITRVVLCLGHLGTTIEAFVGDGSRFGLNVVCQFDGDRLLGTGGALRQALPLLGERFMVLYGDSYLDIPFAPVQLAFERSGAPALMTVLRNEGRWDKSNVVFDGVRVVRHDKHAWDPRMQYIDYGLSLVSAPVLATKPAGEPFDLADFYGSLAAEGRLAGYEVSRRFYEIGTPEGLADTEAFLKEIPMNVSEFTRQYYEEVAVIAGAIDRAEVERMVDILTDLRASGGRLFILGVGGGAGHASHAVNDFRKICGIEAYTPTDNVSELTARINDDGWLTAFANWLRGSRISARDVVLVFSVGGGNVEKNISANLVEALKTAKSVGARIIGIVGRDGGYTRRAADACVVVPVVNSSHVTPHTEAFQAVVWHGLVSHPRLQANEMKWESAR